MTTLAIVLLAVTGWLAVGTLVALLLGGVVRKADHAELGAGLPPQDVAPGASRALPIAA